ncbi:MAG: acetyl-CoA acetyltransferase [Proteobacteria bacterium]|nr:acetyl-CoA acetyltransferase [Pseudomonadota bacterium]
MTMDERTPVIVGVAQLEQREDDPHVAREPLALMLAAVRAAAADCGNPRILAEVDSVRVVRGMWGYGNPARALAEQIGVPRAETGLTSLGGNYVQSLTNRSFLDIQSGRREVIVVTGAECGRTQARASKAGLELDWNPLATAPGTSPVARDSGDPPELYLGSDKVTRHEAELKRGIERPIQFYPMFEIALRHANGESVAAHRERISQLWAGFNKVAVDNPHAWIRTPMSAAQISAPSPTNRAISYPYTKLMNSNNSVDQGAALILTSVGRARRLGISEERWVYPIAGTEAWDHITVSERDNLHSSPAIRYAATKLFELADVGVADLDLVDLYSCFPVAVQVAANEIGLSQDRPLTVTGGLTFAGGPLNNYVMHAVARTVELLRERPGSRGLVSANGGLLTKHALCLYASEPAQKPFDWADLQPEVDAGFRRQVLVDHDGDATLETYVVMYGPSGEPRIAHCACLTPDGQRTWANVTDYDTVSAMVEEEFCGRPARIDGNGGLRFA